MKISMSAKADVWDFDKKVSRTLKIIQQKNKGSKTPQKTSCITKTGPDIRNLRSLRKESAGGRGKETFGKAGQRGGGETG